MSICLITTYMNTIPFWKKSGESNRIAGKIKMGKETLCKLEGKWDGEVLITDLRSGNHE
ncbi:oxysterol-binding -related 8-like isoform X1, partial [Paramuricea clavata]